LYAHRAVLSKSPFFRTQLEAATTNASPATLSLDLSTIKSPVETFKALLIFLYTGQVSVTGAVDRQSVSRWRIFQKGNSYHFLLTHAPFPLFLLGQ
jgi:hypothetical protein